MNVIVNPVEGHLLKIQKNIRPLPLFYVVKIREGKSVASST